MGERLPIVVGETKTPVSSTTSWLNAAGDIHGGYEVKTPGFFVPNVLSFATEGKEFRYGAVRQPAEMWLPWSRTTDELPLPGLASVLRSAELLLRPEMLLDIIRTYTLYSRRSSTAGGYTTKVIPRYPQVEAVEAIVARVRDPQQRQGLVWHHQGSGKTLVMAFAAAKLRQQADLDAPTILVVLDRLDLIEQVSSEFASVGLPGLRVAETKDDLRRLLREDSRGVIVTTIFRFADAGLLNDRANIVVMVDEAHRTQEGRLGLGHARGAAERQVHRPDRHADLDRRPQHVGDVRRPRRPRRRPEPLLGGAVDRRRGDAADPRRDAPRRLPHRPATPSTKPSPSWPRPRARRGPARLPVPPGQPGRHADEDPGAGRGGVRRTSSSTTGPRSRRSG